MLQSLRPAVILLALFTLVTGVVYPLTVTAAGGALFPQRARGSLVEKNGKVIGSSLIGQPFDDDRYFWGRPSATAPFPGNAAASSGSNLGPSNPALVEQVRARLERLREGGPADTPVPVDLVTTSGSGLDPHVSPAAALYQVGRVARARGMTEADVRALVERHIEGRDLGILGEPRVNVLALNLALDAR